MKAQMYVAKNRIIGDIDNRIYGSFVEQLGRAVYEGIYDPGNKNSDNDGLRKDVIDAVKKLNIPIVRFPGGNFLSQYKWEDGIGPVEDRPKRLDLAWHTIETNEFGLHEFMNWCNKVGCQANMAVNTGTRGIMAACNLLEYCNFPKGTYWSDLRRKNGAEKPFAVKTWCVGNEMDGPWEIGQKSAYEYAKLARETAKAMRQIDPNLELVACGSSDQKLDTFGSWEREVLLQCYDYIDMLSLHKYFGYYDGEYENDTANYLAQNIEMDEFIKAVVAICDSVGAELKTDKKINLSFDEWNVWYHSNEADTKIEWWQKAPHLLEDTYNFEDALLVGSLLITLLKNCNRVKMACLAQLVNVIAPIRTNKDGIWLQSIYYPFMQVSNNGIGTTLDPLVDVKTYDCAEHKNVPYIDSIATFNEKTNEIAIFIVNKNEKETCDFTCHFNGFNIKSVIEATQFAGYPVKQTNEDGQMKLQNLECEIDSNSVKAKVLPYSWSMIKLNFSS